jgi:single-stranded DNA-binding protein
MKVITIFGRLTKNGEVRQTDTGKFVTFSVAVNEGYKENQTAIFFDVAYNREGIAPYLTKGKQVTVHGDFKTSVYNDKTYLKIQAYKVELGSTIEGAPKNVAEVSDQNNRMAEGQKVEAQDFDDEIPF